MSVWKHRSVWSALLLATAAGIAGCQDSATHKSTAYERSENALNDPMHYHPDFQKSDTDISGGDITHLDKAGLQRDLNDIANP